MRAGYPLAGDAQLDSRQGFARLTVKMLAQTPSKMRPKEAYPVNDQRMIAGDASLLPRAFALNPSSQAPDKRGDAELSFTQGSLGLSRLLVGESCTCQSGEERASALQKLAREQGPQQAQDSQISAKGQCLNDVTHKPAGSVHYWGHRFGVGSYGLGNLLYPSNRCSLTPSLTGN